MSSVPKPDLAPEAEIVEEDEEQSLPLPEEQAGKGCAFLPAMWLSLATGLHARA